MRYALLITQHCNLACSYCYIGKRRTVMSLPTARSVLDFIFARTPAEERVELGFFGGEPLLAFDRLREITEVVESHPSFDPDRVRLTITTNGTILTPAIVDFVRRHDIGFGISCDGPPEVHDRFRRFRNGRGSAGLVARTVQRALEAFGDVPVNAVYHPQTLEALPAVVEHLSALGVRQIYLNPDFSAPWTRADAARLSAVYRRVGKLYEAFYRRGTPHFISLIDAKITVILRGGYAPGERCRMGSGELAFAPDGGVYPCERLVGDGGPAHRLGTVGERVSPVLPPCVRMSAERLAPECRACGLREYCMNWCGCSNFFSTGDYDRVGPFLCASERAAVEVAMEVFEHLAREAGPAFYEHVAGYPARSSFRAEGAGEEAR